MNQLANFITGLTLASGFISVVFSLEGHFTFASWSVLAAVIFDGLDGQVARMCSITSNFGKEMDSLSDVVAFGIAPSILGYTFIFHHKFYNLGVIAFLFYLVCSVTRLAKFNITPKEKLANYFYGVPTTVSGGLLASYILLYRRYVLPPQQVVFLIAVLALSFFMVSKVRYLNLDGLYKILGKKVILVLSVILVLIILVPEITIFSIFLSYFLFCPAVVKKFYS